MLLNLKVSNLATIQQLDVDFDQGFTILTGETGAGKSILIDALHILLGERSNASLIRSGETMASVEATFDIRKLQTLHSLLEELSIPFQHELIVRGSILKNGRKKIFLNDVRITREKLQEVGRLLLHVHGQHDNQVLLSSTSHITFLDGFGKTQNLVARVSSLYADYQNVLKRQKVIQEQLGERHQRMEYLAFQKQEIEEAQLQEGEEDTLGQEGQVLSHAERLSLCFSQACSGLYEDEESIITQLGRIGSILSDIKKVDSKATSFEEQLEVALVHVEELYQSMSQHASKIQQDPQRLEVVNQRLDRIQKLKRKYGNTVEEMLMHLQHVDQELEHLQHLEEEQQQLAVTIQQIHEELRKVSEELSEKRSKAAKRFDKAVLKEIHALGMEKARFQTTVQHAQSSDDQTPYRYSTSGIDEVEFLLSVNPGQELRSLSKVASGGELSRIMLGLKTVLAGIDVTETLIFDEIDTGISGRIAEMVGLKMKVLGQTRQTLCITHLPQIAAFAENHFIISKTVKQGQTYTSVRLLNPDEQVQEMARLMGGTEITDKTLNLAREMLDRTHSQPILTSEETA